MPGRDISGPRNDEAILRAVSEGSKVIAAWGERGNASNRVAALILGVADIHVLGLTKGRRAKNGDRVGVAPRHPLYMKADTEPLLWKVRFEEVS